MKECKFCGAALTEKGDCSYCGLAAYTINNNDNNSISKWYKPKRNIEVNNQMINLRKIESINFMEKISLGPYGWVYSYIKLHCNNGRTVTWNYEEEEDAKKEYQEIEKLMSA